jgi:hypothetical protein
MIKVRIALVSMTSLSLMASCSSSRAEKLAAIDEVEKHCDLPKGSLSRQFIDEKFSINSKMQRSRIRQIEKTISLGCWVRDQNITKNENV